MVQGWVASYMAAPCKADATILKQLAAEVLDFLRLRLFDEVAMLTTSRRRSHTFVCIGRSLTKGSWDKNEGVIEAERRVVGIQTVYGA